MAIRCSRRVLSTSFHWRHGAIDAIVEMKQPPWIFGATSDDERHKGLGVVVEYAGQKGAPQWICLPKRRGTNRNIRQNQNSPDPDGKFNLVFQKIPGERVRFNRWTINGKSFPDTDPLIVQQGKPYRMIFRNESGDTHPLHLHRHTFEITNFAGTLTGGVHKDVVLESLHYRLKLILLRIIRG